MKSNFCHVTFGPQEAIAMIEKYRQSSRHPAHFCPVDMYVTVCVYIYIYMLLYVYVCIYV